MKKETREIDCPRIATMFGSDNDLGQAVEAHRFLITLANNGRIKIFGEWTNSIHRNPADVLAAIPKLIGNVDAIIVGAGWANQLTGCVNAFLRNLFRDDHIVVYGVAIEDFSNPSHTETAIGSITDFLDSEVIFDNYVGSEGCFRAAQNAAQGIYPVINLRDLEKKPAVRRSMEEALKIGIAKQENKGKS